MDGTARPSRWRSSASRVQNTVQVVDDIKSCCRNYVRQFRRR